MTGRDMAESTTYSGTGHSVTIGDPTSISPSDCIERARCGAKAWNVGGWTTLTLVLHKAVSLLALFLIGLALRNLFTMK
jgi:hypothetical protein